MTDGGGTWARHGRRLVRLEEAWEIMAREGRPLETERVARGEAEGRGRARQVVAGDDHPALDKSMRDGFSVRSADCAAAGARLKIAGLVAAGGAAETAVAPGTAMKINTGAPIPTGADAVVRVEDTDTEA